MIAPSCSVNHTDTFRKIRIQYGFAIITATAVTEATHVLGVNGLKLSGRFRSAGVPFSPSSPLLRDLRSESAPWPCDLAKSSR